MSGLADFFYVSNISTIISKSKFTIKLHKMFIIFLLHVIILLLSALKCTLHTVFSLISTHLESIQEFYIVRGLSSEHACKTQRTWPEEGTQASSSPESHPRSRCRRE
jgi:hypothetical protein